MPDPPGSQLCTIALDPALKPLQTHSPARLLAQSLDPASDRSDIGAYEKDGDDEDHGGPVTEEQPTTSEGRNPSMTTTDQRPTRQITVKEAIASVVGYLARQSGNLAVDYVNEAVTEGALADLRVGLDVIGRRLGDIVQAIHRGDIHVTCFADEL